MPILGTLYRNKCWSVWGSITRWLLCWINEGGQRKEKEVNRECCGCLIVKEKGRVKGYLFVHSREGEEEFLADDNSCILKGRCGGRALHLSDNLWIITTLRTWFDIETRTHVRRLDRSENNHQDTLRWNKRYEPCLHSKIFTHKHMLIDE